MGQLCAANKEVLEGGGDALLVLELFDGAVNHFAGLLRKQLAQALKLGREHLVVSVGGNPLHREIRLDNCPKKKNFFLINNLITKNDSNTQRQGRIWNSHRLLLQHASTRLRSSRQAC